MVGALTAARENGAASGAGVLALYVYDNLGRRISLTRGNGVVTTYAYDSASRLDVLTHNLSGTASDVTLDFGYSAAGQILSRDRTSANGAYVYPQPGLNVDAYASNGLNQIASLDGAAVTHDARGNLTNAGGVSYAYDAFNRLTAAGPLALVYDPAGRLYETTASGTTTRFLYDGLQAIAEYNTSGVLQRRYVPGAGLDEHLAMYEGTGTSDRRYFIQDERGSVVAVSDGAGAALSVNSYDEYGMPAGSNSGLFGYTGQMYLPQAGLYHYRMRAYSPALGRFLQTDPILQAGGLNLYEYVLNDPLNLIDPTGLDWGCTSRRVYVPYGYTEPDGNLVVGYTVSSEVRCWSDGREWDFDRNNFEGGGDRGRDDPEVLATTGGLDPNDNDFCTRSARQLRDVNATISNWDRAIRPGRNSVSMSDAVIAALAPQARPSTAEPSGADARLVGAAAGALYWSTIIGSGVGSFQSAQSNLQDQADFLRNAREAAGCD